MATRSDFGTTWADVVRDWCLGNPLPVPSDDAWAALGTLERLWPEYLEKLLTGHSRGQMDMAPAVDAGMNLGICEGLTGFPGVLGRIRKGERSAAVEVAVAASLVRIGYNPVLEPQLSNKRPDMLIMAGDEEVYFEVIAPDQAMVIGETFGLLQSFATSLTSQEPWTRLELLLATDPTDEVVRAVLDFTHKGELSNEVHELPGIGNVRYEKLGPGVLDLIASIPKQTPGPEAIVSGFSMSGGVNESCFVFRLPVGDGRAQALMDREGQHFSPEKTNILVIDVSFIPGGIGAWTPLIQRRFQPTLNRRFGAVILLWEPFNISTGSIDREWAILRNPYAVRKPPECLLSAITRVAGADSE